MKTTIFVLLLSVACGYVYTNNCIDDGDCKDSEKCLPGCEKDNTPTACDTTCTDEDKVCSWSCEAKAVGATSSRNAIAGDTQTCTVIGGSCGNNGECKHACDIPVVCPEKCGADDVCSHICQAPDTATDAPEASETTTETTGGYDSGSANLELFAPLLVLGTLTKLCFNPW